jgi:hypothetical protein
MIEMISILFLWILFLWIGFAVTVGVAAHCRFARDGGGWFVLAVVISPLLAGLLLLAMGKTDRPQRQLTLSEQAARGKLTGLSRTCPHCESTISATASVCTVCQRESTPTMTRDQLQVQFLAAKKQHHDTHLLKLGVGCLVVAFFIVFAMLR